MPDALTRRRDLFRYAAAVLVFPGIAIAQPTGGIAIISRERLLRDVAAARRLAEAERTLTAALQAKVDEANQTFAAEEAEIADQRASLSPEQFSARVADFDRRVRLWRRTAQDRAGKLQRDFQDARARVVAALPRVLEELRRETGATVILNADQVLAADQSANLTARAVELFDAMAPPPVIPEVDLDLPILGPNEQPPGSEPLADPVSEQ